MPEDGGDPLALGQRLVAILETGARTATYKLATLMALIDHSVEHLPADRDDELVVRIDDLAARVIELYWPQVRPFESQELRQSTQPRAKILRAVSALRTHVKAGDTGLSIGAAQLRAPDRYSAAVREVRTVLVQQPLHRLQKSPGGSDRPFLYDDTWMHDGVGLKTLREHDNALVLFPGVAFALARLAGLLKPVLQTLWVADVRRMNHLDADLPDVAGHLFGRNRVDLFPARVALKEAFGAHCFYCDDRLPADNPVDHVLPWSRAGLDGLANLVSACRRCNGDKGHSLPSLDLMGRALDRDRATLERIATAIAWPTQFDRVVAVAQGIYRGQPRDSLTWAGYHRSTGLDLVFPPDWLQLTFRP